MPDQELENTVEEKEPLPGEEENTSPSEAEDEDDVVNPDGDDLEASGEEEPAAKPSRKAPYIDERQNASDQRAAAAEARALAAEQRLQAQENAAYQRQEQQREQDILATLTPEERSEYKANKAIQSIEGAAHRVQSQIQLQTQNHNDRMAFMDKASSSDLYSKNMKAVEEQANQLAMQGKFLPREVLLDLALAKQMRNASQKGGAAKQRKRGEENVAKSKSASTSRRSDVSGGAKKESTMSGKNASLEKLMKAGAISKAEYNRMTKH